MQHQLTLETFLILEEVALGVMILTRIRARTGSNLRTYVAFSSCFRRMVKKYVCLYVNGDRLLTKSSSSRCSYSVSLLKPHIRRCRNIVLS
jgi:hypothetical protein